MTSEGAEEEYNHMAKYYDVLFSERVVDVPFWVDIVKQLGSPVLEFACGSGRITFPVARTGAEIVGLDVSHAMLTQAHKHLQDENLTVQQAVTFLEANITTFEIPRKFATILSPWGFHVVTREEQDRCLKQVKKHLQPGGYFVVDTENNLKLNEDTTYHKLLAIRDFSTEGFTLVRQSYTTWNATSETAHIVFFLDTVQHDGTMKRFITKRVERVYTNSYMQSLLKAHDFVVEAIYGFYDFRPFEEHVSERSIIVARQVEHSHATR